MVYLCPKGDLFECLITQSKPFLTYSKQMKVVFKQL